MTGMLWLAVIAEDGRWQPGIGDPSPMGWATVAAYLLAAAVCFAYALRSSEGAGHRLLWLGIAAVLLVLGINKQLDVQSLLTQIGRDFSQEQGWYESRRNVQRAFIVVLGAMAAAALALVFLLSRRHWRKNWPALAGLSLLGFFVVARAASFHHMDALINHRIAGVRMNWVLEIGGILIVALAGLINLRSARHAPDEAPFLSPDDAPSPPGSDPAPRASAGSVPPLP